MFYNTGYVADMMDLLFEKVFVNPTPYTDELLAIPVPEYLSAQYEKPDKEEVSSKYTTPPVKMIDDRWAGLPV